jgi:hypothetical protein
MAVAGCAEPAAARGVGDQWFTDDRGVVRRMRVAWHPERGVVVLSLWQGDGCTGTFRLPIADAPRLIALLADDLGHAAKAAAGGGAQPAGAGPAGSARAWLSRVVGALRRRRPRRGAGDVVTLDSYRR